jgi:hypothetical protein
MMMLAVDGGVCPGSILVFAAKTTTKQHYYTHTYNYE